MKPSPKPWLPEGALDPARIALMLDRVLADWSKHWLITEQVSAAPALQDDWPTSNVSSNWRSVADTAAIPLTSNAQTAIVSAMLGCVAPHGPVQLNDSVILESMATTAVDDLLGRITELTRGTQGDSKPTGESINPNDYQWWDISFRSGKRAFKLAVAIDAQVSIVKRQLRAANKPKLKSVKLALAVQKIKLTAELGRCSIGLADFQDLASGDVLILDSSSNESLDLLIDGFPSPFGGTFESIGGEACIMLDKFRDPAECLIKL